jgi:hypothetical protein
LALGGRRFVRESEFAAQDVAVIHDGEIEAFQQRHDARRAQRRRSHQRALL